MAKPELSYIRDQSFSIWHRKLSNHYYMQDIDVFVNHWQIYNNDYDTLALLEEKDANLKQLDLNSPQFKALRKLAKDIPIFVLLTHFNQERSYFTFYLVAANQPAKEFLTKEIGKDRMLMSESDYVTFEASLRKEKPPLTKIDKACIFKDKFQLPRIMNFT